VDVVVDKPRQHEHPGGVDLVVRVLRGPVRLEGQAGRPRGANRGDAVLFDDDIDRASWRRARAVDEHRASDDERLERPGALAGLARRCGNQLVPERLGK
jgi:hypothetical protein